MRFNCCLKTEMQYTLQKIDKFVDIMKKTIKMCDEISVEISMKILGIVPIKLPRKYSHHILHRPNYTLQLSTRQ